MNRTIVSLQDTEVSAADFQGGGTSVKRPRPRPDAYADRLLKLIPAEIVAVWVAMRGTFAAAQSAPVWLQWAAFVILVALIPIYLSRIAGVSKRVQIGVTTGAFVVWAFSLGGAPFSTLPAQYVLPIYGAILLPLYTFAAPLVNLD